MSCREFPDRDGYVARHPSSAFAQDCEHEWRDQSLGEQTMYDLLPMTDICDDALAASSPDDFPEPVARYFAFALPSPIPPIHHAYIAWTGVMLLERGGRPMSFTAQQRYDTLPPGFTWDATMSIFPGVRVHVRDSYHAGVGTTHARVARIIPVVNQYGTPHTAEAALQRYLGESIWFPTALLPSAGVLWSAVDEHTAIATLIDRGNRASVTFHFGDEGGIVGCSALRRRDVGGKSVLTPWRTRTWNYESVNGVMIPRSADAEWVLPDGPMTYWQGTVESLTYEYGVSPAYSDATPTLPSDPNGQPISVKVRPLAAQLPDRPTLVTARKRS
jgi:hypothetical protein